MSTNHASATAEKQSMFVMGDGKNVMFTFILVSSLFLLWGFCNGMIDVMDKHFQDELGLTKSQSAWVQFAHYLGYFLMAMPAGWLATKLGYKGGIIAGLLMVAAGGFWFIPATRINAMARPARVGDDRVHCLPRGGLRHRLRPDVPGDDRQSLHHGAGADRAMRPRASIWRSPATALAGFCGPIIGGVFFYSNDAAGSKHGQRNALYSLCHRRRRRPPVLAVVFYFAYIPDIKTEDDYHLDDSDAQRIPLDLDAPALAFAV